MQRTGNLFFLMCRADHDILPVLFILGGTGLKGTQAKKNFKVRGSEGCPQKMLLLSVQRRPFAVLFHAL